LIGQQIDWQNRAHFFGVAARLMRRILVDHARNQGRLKRGGEQQRLSLTDAAGMESPTDKELIALDEALDRLATLDTRQSQIVELRYFGGLTIDEMVQVLGISHATVEREWSMARAWLRLELIR
jgi:RNA polymerase sigma factor (TIGR02999 family)